MQSKNKLIELDEDIDISKTDDKDEDIYRDKPVQVFRYVKQWKGKKINWKRKHIAWVFWNNGQVSELCEKWVYLNGNYVYTSLKSFEHVLVRCLLLENIKQPCQKMNEKPT